MNDANFTPTHLPEPITKLLTPSNRPVKVRIALDPDLYREITNKVNALSDRIGFKITLAQFIQKTIAEHWEYQVEHYKRLESALKKSRVQPKL